MSITQIGAAMNRREDAWGRWTAYRAGWVDWCRLHDRPTMADADHNRSTLHWMRVGWDDAAHDNRTGGERPVASDARGAWDAR